MRGTISNLVALLCFVSLVALPWVLLFYPDPPMRLAGGAALAWLVLGAIAVTIRDGSPRRR